MNAESIEQIYKSWDRIKKVPNFQEAFGVSLFSRIRALSKRMGDKFFYIDNDDGNGQVVDKMHAKIFTQMMDLIIHMLGPDMDPVYEQLEDLGERHAESYSVSSKHYPIFGEALLDTLELYLHRHYTPVVRDAWIQLWHFMSMSMIKGGRKFLKRIKKEKQRLEKQQQQQQQTENNNHNHNEEEDCSIPPELMESSTSFCSSILDSPRPGINNRRSSSSISPKLKRNSSRRRLLVMTNEHNSAYLDLSDGEEGPLNDDKEYTEPTKPSSFNSATTSNSHATSTTTATTSSSKKSNKKQPKKKKKKQQANDGTSSDMDDSEHSLLLQQQQPSKPRSWSSSLSDIRHPIDNENNSAVTATTPLSPEPRVRRRGCKKDSSKTTATTTSSSSSSRSSISGGLLRTASCGDMASAFRTSTPSTDTTSSPHQHKKQQRRGSGMLRRVGSFRLRKSSEY